MASLTREENLIVALVAAAAAQIEEEGEGRISAAAAATLECMSTTSSSSCMQNTGIHILPWAIQPIFWKYSTEWQALSQGLKYLCPGGGPAVAYLVERFLTLWPDYLKDKYTHNNDDDNKDLRKNRETRNEEGQVAMLAMALQTVLWEKLHTGIWKDVSLVWRDAYSFSCLITAVVELEMTSDVKERRKQALRNLDMALLMGGPLWRQVIIHFISDLVHLIADSSGGGGICDCDSSIESNQSQLLLVPNNIMSAAEKEGASAHAAPPLPPGSLSAHPLSHPIPRRHLLSLETFATDYMLPQHPVIITGAMDTWPALKNWQRVDYWRRCAGPRTVPVEVGKNYMAEEWGQELMLFSEFLDHHLLYGNFLNHKEESRKMVENSKYSTTQGEIKEEEKKQDAKIQKERSCVYLAQHDLVAQIPELARDIQQPEYCSLGQIVHATNTWIGSSGTVTPLHTDPEQNMLCQVVGRKYIRLYAPDQSHALGCSGRSGKGASSKEEESGGYREGNDGGGYLTMNTSPVDVDTHPLMTNFDRNLLEEGKGGSDEREQKKDKSDIMEYPLYAAAPFLDCILESGEMLYIPAGWWHYVKSLSTSASVNFWWRR